MSILDDETLKEIGRFAIEFGNLDEMINTLACAILGCTEWDIAQHLTERLTNGPKLQRIAKVSGILAKAHGLEDTDFYKALLEQIRHAERIVTERNTIIHGEVSVERGKPPIVQLKKKPDVELTPRALSTLVQKINGVTEGLSTAYTDFMIAIEEAQAAAKK